MNEETGEAEAAVSFSRWLQRNIRNLTKLDLTWDFTWDPTDRSEILRTIASATQLCSLQLVGICEKYGYLPASFAGVSALTNLTSLALVACDLDQLAFYSMLTLTQLRALTLIGMRLSFNDDEDDGEEGQIMPDLTSSVVNLTKLKLELPKRDNLVEELVCLGSLTKLVNLDLTCTPVPSGDLVRLVGGLPVTGIKICFDDIGHVPEIAGWIEGCVASTLRRLGLDMVAQASDPSFELQPQVSRLLSPLKSAGQQLQALDLTKVDLSEADSVKIITGLTQLTSLALFGCEFQDDGWALVEAGFGHLKVTYKVFGAGMSSYFHAW